MSEESQELLTAEGVDKAKIIAQFGENSQDCGSSRVQVALLTARIKYLTRHLSQHRKDKHSMQGLLELVAQRKKHLAYLKRRKPQVYLDTIQALGLRK